MDTIGNIFTNGAAMSENITNGVAMSENITNGVHEMK